MKKIKIGFLPFYIKLYDDTGNGAAARPRLWQFYLSLCERFEKLGFEVVRTNDLCRIEPEFRAAVDSFEAAEADCIVTWHAAYSPSLECVRVLTGTRLPIVVLDTTETYDFSPEQNPAEISCCHGIHGVMDMCSLLRRYGKKYAIAAGHFEHSDVIERAAGYVRATAAAAGLNGSRVGSIGGSFDGMGDFLVSDEEMLSRFGVTVVYPTKPELEGLLASVSDDEARREMAVDRESCYEIEPVNEEIHLRTARNSLAVRHWLEESHIDAFTANFREICPGTGLQIMPFMEACKALSRGVGYAGEGDVLTASLVGALLKGFPHRVSFIEIFCPDWKGDRLLLSHMGEYNPDLICRKAGMKEINFIFGEAENPVVSYGCYRGGDAVFVNLYRAADDFRMLISPVEMESVEHDNFEPRVRGWMKPHMPVPSFLETISRAGVTHHSALVYDAKPEEIGYFADLLGINYKIV